MEEQREKSNQAKEQAFEDMLAGKQTQITDDMNLQQVFKAFYNRAKQVDVKTGGQSVVNSAMNSLGGFSSKLEARRQAAREKKQDQQKAEDA